MKYIFVDTENDCEVISGKIKYFYPQGTIIDLGAVQGCGDASDLDSKLRYRGCVIHGTVTGYDDKNMWVLIGKCINIEKIGDVENGNTI